jgi:ribosome-dependent ATPase
MSPARVAALVVLELTTLMRDPFRLTMVFAVPTILLLLFGYGLTLDVENLKLVALDRDRTPQSREYIEAFTHSRYFQNRGSVESDQALEYLFRAGEATVAVEIPAGFGRDLKAGYHSQVAIWIDGTSPFRAETARSYAEAMHLAILGRLAREARGEAVEIIPASIETRFWYNQSLESKYAFVPGIMAALLLVAPAMFTAIAVVREKELGSITNFRAAPTTRIEFLLGKQIPHAAISFLNFIVLSLLTVFLFGVPLTGSVAALAIGAFLYVLCATALGLLVSSVAKSQFAAILITTIVTLLPSFLYSGLMIPVSSLAGGAAVIARLYPAMYFLDIAVGVFTKGLGFAVLAPDYVALAAFLVVFIAAAAAFLPKQEA